MTIKSLSLNISQSIINSHSETLTISVQSLPVSKWIVSICGKVLLYKQANLHYAIWHSA